MSECCNDPLNIGGEGFNCDQEFGHPLPHMSKLAHAIWGSDDIVARERERIVVLLESDDVMGVDDALYYILHDQHMEDE